MSGRRRRVLHVITRMIVGGAQENTLLSVLGTDATPGWASELVSGPALGREGDLLAQPGVRAPRMHVVPHLRREVAPVADALALVHLVWLFVRLAPDVVHTHSSKAGILGRIAARLAGVPVVVHTIHGLAFHPFQPALVRRLWIVLERLAARLADRIFAVAGAMGDEALAAGVGYPRLFEVVPSGMDTEAFVAAGDDQAVRRAVRARLGVPDDAQVIVLVGRLFERKGHDDLLAVAARLAPRHPRLWLLFVGDGPRHAELVVRARDLGLEGRVVFAGLVPPAAIPGYLAAADLLVHTSLVEGLARVLPQALLAGRPVVAYDVGGAREVVIDGVTGGLVAIGDLAGLERWCDRFLGDPEYGARLAAAGRALCRERFAAATMVARLVHATAPGAVVRARRYG